MTQPQQNKKDLRIWFAGLPLILALAGSAAHATEHKPSSSIAIPDKALLDFIAEFEDTDDETFEIIFFFGQRDAGKPENNAGQELIKGGNQQ